MKKIGICTLYYQNRNYGANLQAYALRYTLEKLGVNAELVPYYYRTRVRRLLSSIKQRLKKNSISKNVEKRNRVIDKFNNLIPHSKVYYSNTIHKANKYYDCFITGSDQVWNPDWINKYLSLDFVEDGKVTASYAASTGKVNLNVSEQQKLKRALNNTKYISIRENDSIASLQKLTDKPIINVLDPTLLLSRSEWDEICSDRIITDNYLFCYFLGDNEHLRELAYECARKNGLKVVTLPYLNLTYRSVDEGFGDYALFNVSPNDFLSLIKYASFIITDSFHASVFSHIFERPFVVSGKKENEMGCRLKSLTDMFNTQSHYFVDHEMVTVDKIDEFNCELQICDNTTYQKMKEISINFLKMVINDGQFDL